MSLTLTQSASENEPQQQEPISCIKRKSGIEGTCACDTRDIPCKRHEILSKLLMLPSLFFCPSLLSVPLSVPLFVPLSILCLSIFLSIFLPVHISDCSSVSLPISPSVSLSVYMNTVRLSAYPSACLYEHFHVIG